MFDLRFDRLISVAAMSPVLHLLSRSRQDRIPILMYHGIAPERLTAEAYFETNTSPEVFEAQMRWLFDNGYTTVSIGGCLGPLVDGRDTRRVAITFDDGYRNFYTAAVPVLTRYGFTATVFVVSDFVTAAAYMGGDRRYMTWAEINAVQSLGIEIGSHSASHPKLWRLSRRQVEEELSRSKTAIEKAIGKPVRSFSHPFAFPEQYARFIKLMAELLEKHGYEVGVSTIIGTASVRQRRYFLPRIPINEHDDPALFRAKLIGAYDWMHVPQRLAKFCVRSAVANGN